MLTWKSEEKREAQKWSIWQTLVEERRKVCADWDIYRHILPAFLKHKSEGFYSDLLAVLMLTEKGGEAWMPQHKMLAAGRPDPKFGEAKRSLAPDLMACWIRPRECTSEQPVLLAAGTEGKLHTHKAALWYGCKKPRNNHIRGYFKKWQRRSFVLRFWEDFWHWNNCCILSNKPLFHCHCIYSTIYRTVIFCAWL